MSKQNVSFDFVVRVRGKGQELVVDTLQCPAEMFLQELGDTRECLRLIFADHLVRVVNGTLLSGEFGAAFVSLCVQASEQVDPPVDMELGSGAEAFRRKVIEVLRLERSLLEEGEGAGAAREWVDRVIAGVEGLRP